MSNEENQDVESVNQETITISEQDENMASLLSVLATFENAPDEITLESWRETYGKFFASSVVGDDSIFVWRTLNRTEYKQMVNTGVIKNPMTYEEALVKRCMLWPKITADAMQTSDAGIVPTLAKQILHKSGFVSEQMALAMIKVI